MPEPEAKSTSLSSHFRTSPSNGRSCFATTHRNRYRTIVKHSIHICHTIRFLRQPLLSRFSLSGTILSYSLSHARVSPRILVVSRYLDRHGNWPRRCIVPIWIGTISEGRIFSWPSGLVCFSRPGVALARPSGGWDNLGYLPLLSARDERSRTTRASPFSK